MKDLTDLERIYMEPLEGNVDLDDAAKILCKMLDSHPDRWMWYKDFLLRFGFNPNSATRISELEAQVDFLKDGLKLYENALDEAEAIFGGEYADAYGPLFDMAMKARRAAALVEK